jgi:hypothetical protein
MTHCAYRFITFSDLLKCLLLIVAITCGFSVSACDSQDTEINSSIHQMIEAEHLASNANSQGHKKNHDSQHCLETCCLGFCDCSHANSIWTPVSDYGNENTFSSDCYLSFKQNTLPSISSRLLRPPIA